MKIGILGGYGSIGSRHVQNAKALGHDVLVYDPARPAFSMKHEHQLYDDADAVVIASPTIMHEQAIRACIERGKHMLIEKPIAPSISDALPGLLDLATAKGLVAMMGCNLRYHPCVIMMKQTIEDGHYGLPLWGSFTCCTENGPASKADGVLLSTGAHEVDLAMHLLGPAITNMGSFISNTVAMFSLAHQTGYGCFHLNITTPFRTRNFTVAMQKATFHVDLDARKFRNGNQVTPFSGGYTDDYLREMRAFIDRIKGKEDKHGATASNGLATLKVLQEIAPEKVA